MNKKASMAGLMLITDSGLFPDKKSFFDAIKKALAGGVRLIQLREKGLDGREFLTLARRLREITRGVNAELIINGRADIAMLARADGLHLPASAFSPTEARGLMGEDALIGVSTHSADEAQRAGQEGADYITFGPIYETPSKACYGAPVGIAALKKTASLLSIPVYALGGIKRERIREVMEAGALGVALISAILASDDITASSREIIKELEDYKYKKC